MVDPADRPAARSGRASSPAPCPRPNRSIQPQVQSCARCRAAPSPTAARSSSQAKPCTSSSKAGSGIEISQIVRLRRLDQMAREQEVPGHKLPPARRNARWSAARAATRTPAQAAPAPPSGHAGGSAPGSAAPKSRRAWSRLPHLCQPPSAPASGSARGHHSPAPGGLSPQNGPLRGARSQAMKNPSIPPRSAQ